MKKLLLTLGAIASIAAPVTAVVACSNNDAQEKHTVQFSATLADLGLQTMPSGSRARTELRALAAKGYPFAAAPAQTEFMSKFGGIFNSKGNTYREILINMDEVSMENNNVTDVLGLKEYFIKDTKNLFIFPGATVAPFDIDNKSLWDAAASTVMTFLPGEEHIDTILTGFKGAAFAETFGIPLSTLDSIKTEDELYNLIKKNWSKAKVTNDPIKMNMVQVPKDPFYKDKHIELWVGGKKLNLDDNVKPGKVELTVKIVDNK